MSAKNQNPLHRQAIPPLSAPASRARSSGRRFGVSRDKESRKIMAFRKGVGGLGNRVQKNGVKGCFLLLPPLPELGSSMTLRSAGAASGGLVWILMRERGLQPAFGPLRGLKRSVGGASVLHPFRPPIRPSGQGPSSQRFIKRTVYEEGLAFFPAKRRDTNTNQAQN